jgi:hypothetical protein
LRASGAHAPPGEQKAHLLNELQRRNALQVGHGEAVARVRVHRAALAGAEVLLQQEAHHVHVQPVHRVQQRVARVLAPKALHKGQRGGLEAAPRGLHVALYARRNEGLYRGGHRFGLVKERVLRV